jgi:hypothetical protein
MRALIAAVVLLAGCDFYQHKDRPSVDAGVSTADGGSEACASWTLESADASALEMMDEPPYETGRSARVMVTTELDECQERAMPLVDLDVESMTVAIRLAVWQQAEGDCGPAEGTISRPVVISIPDPGTWTITADGAEPLSVKFDPGPGGQCGTGGEDCRRDCDCNSGEVCLRATGLGGPFTACVRSCELDRDCGGDGTCADVADSFARSCATGDECEQNGEPACPDGYSCELDSASCTPGFTLSEEARGPCTCDSDCAEGLHCVRGRPDQEAHCEVACPTGGPWCEGAHACGTAAQDASGLATTDSVCVWLGE